MPVSLIPYNGLQILSSTPSGDGGGAIQSNFIDLATWHPRSTWTNTTNPTSSDNASSSPDYYAGSFWLNTTPLPQLFFCESSTTTTATWQSILSAVVQDPAPELGGNLNLNGNQITDATDITLTIASIGIAKVTSVGLQSTAIGIGAAPQTGIDLYMHGTASNSVPFLRITDGTVELDYYIGTGGNAQFGTTTANDFLIFADNATSLHLYGDGTGNIQLAGNVALNNPAVTQVFPTNATHNLVLQGGLTSPVLGAATSHTVSIAAVDKASGDRRLYIQSENGSPISLGYDRLNFGAATGYLSIGGTDVAKSTSTSFLHLTSFGYAVGTGGTVTQSTNKSTGVTLNTSTGQITMNNAALAGGAIVSFTLTDSQIAATDVLVLNHISGGTVGSYVLNAQAAAGSATVTVTNVTSGSLSEAIVIQFCLVKGATS